MQQGREAGKGSRNKISGRTTMEGSAGISRPFRRRTAAAKED